MRLKMIGVWMILVAVLGSAGAMMLPWRPNWFFRNVPSFMLILFIVGAVLGATGMIVEANQRHRGAGPG